MSWFKVDDNLAFHRKTVKAGNAAMGLWVRAGSWSAQQLTDGFVPDEIAALLGTPQQAARLVAAELWEKQSGGFSYHEWDERQPKKDQILAERAAGAERKRLSRGRKKGTIPPEPLVGDGSHENVQRRSSVAPQRPDPTRPDHIDTPNGVSGARKRGTRLPDGWIPQEKTREQIITECPGVDLRREHLKFVDFWQAKSGKDATKVDWDATWRNWMRNAKPTIQAHGPASDGARYERTW